MQNNLARSFSVSRLGSRRRTRRRGAQEGRTQTAKATKWSDPATWPNNKVPAAGDKVAIAKDKDVILDVNTPALGGVTIDGKLSFADNADVELTTEWIMLHGELAIGTEAKPHARKATITLTDNVKGENIMAGMGDRGIMIFGRHAQPAWGSHPHLDQAVRDGQRRRHLDPGARCPGLESRRRDRPRLDGLRSPPGRAPHDCRHQGQQRSRSTRSWTTCTSARSPSTWMSAAKWVS